MELASFSGVMRIRTVILNFTCDEPVKARADKLRGFFASRFGEYTLVHHHLGDKHLLYQTPLIQFKIVEGKPLVLGINEGAAILRQIYEEIDYIKIGTTQYKITNKKLFLMDDNFGTAVRFIPYTFLTPWLALNEENYEKYQCLGSWGGRKELLEKILIGNILSVAKSLNYTVTEPIQTEIKEMKETKTKLKGTPMLGFLGGFLVNFEIPDYWGLGKSVARGFGTVKRV